MSWLYFVGRLEFIVRARIEGDFEVRLGLVEGVMNDWDVFLFKEMR